MAETRQTTVVAVFANRTRANEAIASLQDSGFQGNQIRQYVGKGHVSGPLTGIKNIFSAEQKTPEAVVNDLLDMGVAPEHTGFYRREYESGHPLITVTDSKHLQDATAILQRHGGYGPQGERERRSGAYAGSEAASAQRETMGTADAGRRESVAEQRGSVGRVPETSYEQEQHMRLHAEHLQAQKQAAQLGEVVVRKELVTDQESIDVPLRHEEVVIQRRALAEEAGPAERLGEGQTIRIPVSGEQVNLTKHVVTTGELIIGKHEVEETRHFSDAVQHEEARLEHTGDIPIWDENFNQPSTQPGV